MMFRVARLLEETGRVDVKPPELNPGGAAARPLHGVDGGDGSVDGVHARGRDKNIIGKHPGEERR